MRKIQIFLIFICLLAASLLTTQLDNGVLREVGVVSPGFSITTDWFQGNDRLSRLELLKRVLNHIHESYVDPDRLNPQAMLRAALDRISETVTEVRIIYPAPGKAVLLVDKARLELETNLPSVFALQSTVSDILKFVRANKRSDISEENLEITAINGILSTLDPHSVFLTKDLYAETKVGTTGKFGGLGIVIGLRDSKLTIISPLEDTPAFRAGLLAEDQILKIGDESTSNMSLTEAVERMRGPKGVPVTITVLRKTWTAPKEFTLIRDIIKIVSVESQLLPGHVGYVKVKSFQGNTAKDLNKHLAQLRSAAGGNLKGLVLDLRNNPGGLLDQSVDVSDAFLRDGPIVTTVGYGNTVRDEERATQPGTEPDYPIAVLVNPGSASASEIVAGALQRRGRAVVVGQRTFGKGTVQSIFDLPEDTALKLTIAQYLTPGGISIQSIGIVPDIRIAPAVVNKDRVDLFPPKEQFGEAELEHHFDNPKAKQTVAEPQVVVTYFEGRTEKELTDDISEAQGSKAAVLKDFTVQFSADLVRQARGPSRDELIALAKRTAGVMTDRETVKVTKALATQGIDWSEPATADKKGKACGSPVLSAKVLSVGKRTLAGESIEVALTAKNPHSCTLYQAWARSESTNYLFTEREFLFGKLAPGREIERKVKVEIPKSTPTNLAEVDFHFQQGESTPSAKQHLEVAIKSVVKPQFAFQTQVRDQSGNQLIERGEKVELKVHVQNVGEGPVEDASAVLKTESRQVNITRGRSPIRKLKPGEADDISFLFDVKPTFSDPAAEFDLSMGDMTYRVFTNKQLTFKISAPKTPLVAAKTAASAKTGLMLVPPVISVNEDPLAFEVAKKQFVRLKGQLSDHGGVKDLVIFVNKRKVFYESYDDRKGSLFQAFETTLPLEPGVNRILMVARDRDDLTQRDAFIIQRDLAPLSGSEVAHDDQSPEAIDDYLLSPTLP